MIFFKILLLVWAAFLFQCQSAEDVTTSQLIKCDLNTIGVEKVVQLDLSWIAIEGQPDEPPTKGSNDKATMNMCPTSNGMPSSGPIVDADTLKRCKATPHNCKLADGSRAYFYDDYTGCFRQYNTPEFPWGISRMNDPLAIYSSVGAKDAYIGITLYIKQLDGLLLPNATTKHNGCVRVDHYCPECVGFGCPSLRLFVGNKRNSIPASIWPQNVTAMFITPCVILKYD